MTKVKRPRVSMLIGKVRMIRMGRKKAFNTPRIAAAKKALQKPYTSMPSMRCAATRMAPVRNSQRIRRPFIAVSSCDQGRCSLIKSCSPLYTSGRMLTHRLEIALTMRSPSPSPSHQGRGMLNDNGSFPPPRRGRRGGGEKKANKPQGKEEGRSQNENQLMTDLGVASKSVTTIFGRMSILSTSGLICFSQVSLSYTFL